MLPSVFTTPQSHHFVSPGVLFLVCQSQKKTPDRTNHTPKYTAVVVFFRSLPKVPLNNKETMMQRQISIDREEPEAGLEALEEPLKAKKPLKDHKWPGRFADRCLFGLTLNFQCYHRPLIASTSLFCYFSREFSIR